MRGELKQDLLQDLYAMYQPVTDGKVARYIPELAKAKPDWFGIAVVLTDGTVFQAGDAGREFTIQSISKVLTYALALADHGREAILDRIGVHPVVASFNAIILDERTGRPYNPMINAGAIAVASLIKGADLTERLNRVLDVFECGTGRRLGVDAPVFTSERGTGHRNRAIAHMLLASGILASDIDTALDLYFNHCSLRVTAVDIATIAAALANKGVNPVTGERVVESSYVGDVLSVMYTCGMYDSSGEWAYHVGLPGKSGVSGGLMAVVPGKMGIAVFSPPLDDNGHSVRGLKVCEALSERLCLHLFAACDDD